MKITKTHTGIVITRDGAKRFRLYENGNYWIAGKNERYHKSTGRRQFAESTRRRLLLDSIRPINMETTL
ncbi:hypothetical protein EHB58_09670 [Salmonella enterica subsp. enterica serovar Hull]|uniref:Uncharacterized protein n=1 Tax=Salmonella enterica subsp. enterica serovar Hull TaxID=1403564 RepID=A0A5X4PE36_SALET|nr:hypothetical protein [Salmonella enterica]EBZ7585891.1 hypothetical protein [Salmonella enterica subsp. enterica serovar Hull]EBZ8648478.1 hypothetical protein [Salmonella enterica subsp. enterica serovar Hull]